MPRPGFITYSHVGNALVKIQDHVSEGSNNMDMEEWDKNQFEDVILLVGERMSDAVYERYMDGEFNPDELREAYDLLSQWNVKGRKILQMMS